MDNFADRLLEAIDAKGSPVCVGIDPRWDLLPEELRDEWASQRQKLGAVEEFCGRVLEAVCPVVPAVKIQSAYFEVFREGGQELYFRTVRLARRLGLVVIGDVKRSDIGSTATAYAEAHLAGADTPDAVTVNGYLGSDGIDPFCEVAARDGKGLFVLVRTSNSSAPQLQDFASADGTPLYQHVAAQVAALGDGDALVGSSGYSSLGAVVGATYPDEARALRKIMPRQIFLVPGYGAQGATAADCAASFDPEGRGAIVNASRSVIYAFARPEHAGVPWAEAVATAARRFAEDISKAVSP
jgi:orotidine-5'-phosphate decarboxylase